MQASIDDHGLIGDMRTAALVSTGGDVTWLCYPRFDSPSVFAALLDEQRGGRFSIAPTGDYRERQRYVSQSCVLITAFQGEAGLLEVIDFMPVPTEARISLDQPLGVGGPPPRLTRLVRATTGTHTVSVRCQPAFDYARAGHQLHLHAGRATFEGPDLTLHLDSGAPLAADGTAAVGTFTLRAGESCCFTLSSDPAGAPQAPHDALQDTLDFWRGWLAQCTYQGRWRNHVHRSALTLKLLTYAPSGAIIAAPTTSLPERVGGERNWDYRYSWPRDAAFTVYALLRLGFRAEAKAFNHFILSQPQGAGGEVPLRTMYTISGEGDLTECTLDHLSGYRGSRPVRVGNGAAGQFQLDIFGEFLDAAYLYNKHGEPLAYDDWVRLRRILDFVSEHWRDPDDGIWEARSGQAHHVLSKVMCWVALDRGVRIARQRGLPGDTERWQRERDAVLEDVMASGHDGELNAFTQTYDSDTMDAANLLLPLVRFVGPRDPRWIATLDRIEADLATGPLVYRYRLDQGASDGLTGEEGTFLACAYWLVECLARARRVAEARDRFEHLLTLQGPLGLLSEELSPGGLPLGNYPQALSHLALISAAFHLDRALAQR